MRHLDLFSGIGGFALATEMVWEDVEHVFCDNDDFCNLVLKKHWPDALIYGDIRTLTNTRGEEPGRLPKVGRQSLPASWNGTCDLLTGGFPCQPFSSAGRRRGTEDDRHLWPEMLRVIREVRPTWVVGENVGGLLTWNGGMVLDQVFSDLEGEGYEVGAFVIPACATGAPHRRDRVWITAHTERGADGGGTPQDARTGEREGVRQWDSVGELGESGAFRDVENAVIPGTRSEDKSLEDKVRGTSESGGAGIRQAHGTTGPGRTYSTDTNAPDPESERSERRDGGQRQIEPWRSNWEQDWFEVATRLCRVDDGLPRRMDRNPRLKALGNAIVPQVAAEVMRGIKLTGTT